MTHLELWPVSGLPLFQPGDDLAGIIVKQLSHSEKELREGDIVVVAQKVVSKVENCFVTLSDVTPSARALALAEQTGKDPRQVEVILWDSAAIIRAVPGVLIVQHKLGFISANAGVDHSNVAPPEAEMLLRLPSEPDLSAHRLRERFVQLTGHQLAVLVIDSHGRPWRYGTSGVAIGVAGINPLEDLRGQPDLFGVTLEATTVALTDQIAAAASLVMGQADEGRPVVIVRGLPYRVDEEARAAQVLRPAERDLFR